MANDRLVSIVDDDESIRESLHDMLRRSRLSQDEAVRLARIVAGVLQRLPWWPRRRRIAQVSAHPVGEQLRTARLTGPACLPQPLRRHAEPGLGPR